MNHYDSWSDEELLEHRLAARREIAVQKAWGDRRTKFHLATLHKRVATYTQVLRERGFADAD